MNVEKQNQIAIILGIGLILSCLFLCQYSQAATWCDVQTLGDNVIYQTPNGIVFPNASYANEFTGITVTGCTNHTVAYDQSGTYIGKDSVTGVTVFTGHYSWLNASKTWSITVDSHTALATHATISFTFSPAIYGTFNVIGRTGGTTYGTIAGYGLKGTHTACFDDNAQLPNTQTIVSNNCNWTEFKTYMNPSSDQKFLSTYVYNYTTNYIISHSVGSTFNQWYNETVYMPLPGQYVYSFSYSMNNINYAWNTNFNTTNNCLNNSNITGPVNPYITPVPTGPWGSNTTWNNLTFPVVSNWTNYNVTPIGFFPPYLTNWTIMNKTDILNYFNTTLIPIDLVNGYFNLIDNLINSVKNAIQQALSVLLSPIFWLIGILSQIQSWETMILAQLIYYIAPLKLIFNVVFYILPQPIYYLILFVLVYYLIKIILKGRK